MISVELVTKSNESEYREFVAHCSCALVQHTLEWRDIVSSLSFDTPAYLIAKKAGRVVGVLPSFIYRYFLGDLLVSIPHAGGYGGVVVEEDLPEKDEVYKVLLEKLILEARSQKCLLITISTPPFLDDLSFYREFFQPDFEVKNFFQYLNLETVDLESKQIRENIRRSVRKAQSYGLEIVRNDAALFDSWYKIYQAHAERLGSTPIPYLLLKQLKDYVLNTTNGSFSCVLDEKKVIGGALFVGLNKVIDYFMGAFDPEFKHKQPNSLLMYEVIKLAQKQDYKYWNWQSCISKDDGVYHYKAGWGSEEKNHYYLTKTLGDLTTLKRADLSLIKQKYLWHYVLPWGEFDCEL
jgi:hypothetical protein